MKTIIKISNDYYSDLSYQMFREQINYLVNELDIFCEVKNDKFENIVEREKRYLSSKDDYKNKTIVNAIGYSQGDWQEYILYHNLDENDNDLKILVDELKKSFTHFNDYFVEKFEQEEIKGKKFNSEVLDITSFSITDIEFPDENDILDAYIEIYGKDFDKCIIEVD